MATDIGFGIFPARYSFWSGRRLMPMPTLQNRSPMGPGLQNGGGSLNTPSDPQREHYMIVIVGWAFATARELVYLCATCARQRFAEFQALRMDRLSASHLANTSLRPPGPGQRSTAAATLERLPTWRRPLRGKSRSEPNGIQPAQRPRSAAPGK